MNVEDENSNHEQNALAMNNQNGNCMMIMQCIKNQEKIRNQETIFVYIDSRWRRVLAWSCDEESPKQR